MNALALDTLKVAKRLRDAGFSEAQAESVTDAIRDGVTGGDVATKDDLGVLKDDVRLVKEDVRGLRSDMDALRADVNLLRSDTNAAIARLEGRIDTKIAQSQSETLKWVFGMMVAQGAFVVTLIKLLPGK